jgi:hypothetical protein
MNISSKVALTGLVLLLQLLPAAPAPAPAGAIGQNGSPGASALEGAARSKPAITFNAATKILTIRVSHPQRLSISAFVLTGKQVNRLSTEKFFEAGTHQISLNNQKLGDGIVIFKVEGPGFSESRTINLSR